MRAAAAAMVIGGFLAMIVASPWLMRSVLRESDEWGKLSDVGQAYGGVSAVLSGFALCGVAGSLLLQRRQIRLNQIMAARERHFELIKLELDNPDVMWLEISGVPEPVIRKWIVRNLWVAHWSLLWETGSLSLSDLRTNFDQLFRESTARDWWAAAGEKGWGYGIPGRSGFFAVADEAYRDACAALTGGSDLAGPETPPTEPVEDAGASAVN